MPDPRPGAVRSGPLLTSNPSNPSNPSSASDPGGDGPGPSRRVPQEPLGPVETPEPGVVDVPEPGVVEVPERRV